MSPSNVIGFRVLGGPECPRRPVDWRAAWFAHLLADNRSEPCRESYLSLFHFGAGGEFASHLGRTGSVRGYGGPVGGDWFAFDIDRGDIETARLAACRLVGFILERYRLGEDEPLTFFSGSKGFHVCLPAELVGSPPPGLNFAAVAAEFCKRLAAGAGVAVDSIYDSVRLFRAPNSTHPKTGAHKIPLTWRELSNLSADRIQELAREPRCRELGEAPAPCPVAVRDWGEAVAAVESPRAVERIAADRTGLRDSTWGTLEAGILEPGGGDSVGLDGKPLPGRHKCLFAAAADLGKFDCPPGLAWALLGEIGMRSGLPRGEVERTLANGLEAGRKGAAE